MNETVNNLVVDLDLIRRLDKNGPRYTSYPTADRFSEAFDEARYRHWLTERAAQPDKPLSLYIHIPFCNTLCFYCACNKVITKDYSKADEYVDYLLKEMAMQAQLLGERQVIQQLHFGGGTPTFLSDEQMQRVMAGIAQHFELIDEGEYSIEIDPRKVSQQTIQMLAQQKFNRISIGVQDFDEDVQKAVNRIQSEQETLDILTAARDAGFQSASIDLIYGLPKQTLEGFARTLDKIIAADPDRLSIYNYAHMPKVFKPQRRIDEADLPQPQAKLDILSMAVDKLTNAGYVYIGMDHFAKPEDELAVAQREGCLHRNFQGYSTHSDCDLIALGVSAIGKIGLTYSGNYRDLDAYYAALDQNRLPVMRGIELTQDDQIRREIIQMLMCHFELDKSEVNQRFGIAFDSYFELELQELADYEQEGLLQMNDERITVTPKGRMLIRNICMIFDFHLRNRQAKAQYSKVI